ncbi:Protein DEL-7 [Aphelenchoides avenae]|nr:Protein DEL-7 [Aphelenchus avenae]
MDERAIRLIVAYAISGAGFDNVDKIIKKVTVDNQMRLSRLFRKWVGKRSYEAFYKTLFETYGYQCDELFHSCLYGTQHVRCCDIFEQSYVMLRGRCFRLKEFYQTEPDQEGKLVLLMEQLSSWVVEESGVQPQTVVYLTEPDSEAAMFPRYYFNPGVWNKLIINKRDIRMLDSNPHCKPRCKRCGKSKCYIKQ